MDKRTEHNKTKQNSPFQIICNSTKAQYEAYGLKQNHTSNLQKNQKKSEHKMMIVKSQTMSTKKSSSQVN